MKRIVDYFSKFELFLWSFSVITILAVFFLFEKTDIYTTVASLIGVTSIILNAKGNPLGQALMVVFGVYYGVISYFCAYYGEMITYVGMTAPMAVLALVSWLKNPYKGNKAEVEVNSIRPVEVVFMLVLTAAVTAVFYYILKFLGTANLIPSTVSVTTSFIAVYLTFRRSAWFSLAYAANDLVLIVLWSLAAAVDLSYLSVIICFVMFLINDVYAFINWQRIKKRQKE